MAAPPPDHDPDATTPDSRPSSSLHGRFDPGTRLGSRYRVVGLLGRGGMGEVYRADDLELNQSVALKFLPEKVARNPADLARLRQEVRIARQIAHPNVCRTYDIAEAGGEVFVVMEYVDGEDLASVLRRLGRPTPDKAVEIARAICLGLGAAHENGVIHRDLKPGNIMIDGRGRVRITDFGIAGTVDELAAEGGIAGTPEYMAPEQRQTGAATVQSDIYSLGLVLFEVFTGKRASEMPPPRDGPTPGSDSSVVTPSSLVADIDAAVERVIMRCLARDPARRPQSAYAVFGALPGSDPLAAAVAAGETPSPELVARAGEEGSLKPWIAGLLVAAVVATVALASAIHRPDFAGLDRPPEALALRAEEILTSATGAAPPRYSMAGFRYEPGADSTSVPAFQYWRRWSTVPLDPVDLHVLTPTLENPPQTYPGSGTILLDPRGRLLALSVVPSVGGDTTTPSPAAVDWAGFLRAAGRGPGEAAATIPPRRFHVRADTVAAWALSDSAAAAETTFVAAATGGRIVQAETYVGAGSRPLGDLAVRIAGEEESLQFWFLILFVYIVPMTGGLVLARRNAKMGRIDVRGALVAAAATVVCYLAGYVFTTNIREIGLARVVENVGAMAPLAHALVHALIVALAYLAIEPYVRRLWPRVFVSWQRLLSGRVRDPIVGRDMLIGAATGCLWCFGGLVNRFGPVWLSLADRPWMVPDYTRAAMMGPKAVLAIFSLNAAQSVFRPMIVFTVLVILRFLFRNARAAVIGTILLDTVVFVQYGSRATPLYIATGIILEGITVLIVLRYGFLVGTFSIIVGSALDGFPWTTDLGGWLAPQALVGWVLLGAILVYAFATATHGRSLFRDPLAFPAATLPRRG
jgi:serine/threonine-protein kinase